jgi:hypothetical protein
MGAGESGEGPRRETEARRAAKGDGRVRARSSGRAAFFLVFIVVIYFVSAGFEISFFVNFFFVRGFTRKD